MGIIGNKTELRRAAKWFVIAAFVVFLHFSGYISSMSKIRNRYFKYWDSVDSLAVVFDILLLAAVAVAIGLLIERSGKAFLRRLYRHLFLLALGSGIIANTPSFYLARSAEREVLWLVLFAIVGYSFALSESRIIKYSAALCLVLSPLMLILMVPMVGWTNWNVLKQPNRAPLTRAESSTPVFFFVFDEWSYARSTRNGEFLPQFPNLRNLAQQSFTFSDVSSPSYFTHHSLPMIIHQSDSYQTLPGVLVRKNGVEGLHSISSDDAKLAADNPKESLFELAKRYDYNTNLIGFYIPYGRVLGDELDHCTTYCSYPKGASLPGRMEMTVLEGMRYWADPLSVRKWRRWYSDIFVNNWIDINNRIESDVKNVIAGGPDNNFTFVHWPLPHAPFVYKPDGSHKHLEVDLERTHNDDEDRMYGTPDDYEQQLEYLDVVIGRVMDQLKAQGKFDQSLLILTSDHSWRNDPDQVRNNDRDPRLHVPLILKLPNQHTPVVVSNEFTLTRLGPVIERVLHNQASEQDIASLVEAGHHDLP